MVCLGCSGERVTAAAADWRGERGGLGETIMTELHFDCIKDKFLAEMADRREQKTAKRFQWIGKHMIV